MVEVYKNLYVGNQEDFFKNPISFNDWAVVHACKEPFHRNLLGYIGRGAPKDDSRYLFGYDKQNHLVLNIVDCDKPEYFADEMIEEAIKYVIDALNKGRKALIHCNQGESRAPSIALMVLKKLKKVDSDFNKAVSNFISIYPSYKPAQGINQYMQMKWNNL